MKSVRRNVGISVLSPSFTCPEGVFLSDSESENGEQFWNSKPAAINADIVAALIIFFFNDASRYRNSRGEE